MLLNKLVHLHLHVIDIGIGSTACSLSLIVQNNFRGEEQNGIIKLNYFTTFEFSREFKSLIDIDLQ